jgi:hypothetical protein
VSYARFGWDDSDVYVFCSREALECCGCILQQREAVDAPGSILGWYLREAGEHIEQRFTTTAGMIAHLEAHRAAGHVVPDDCISDLLADAAENDAALRDRP